MLKWYDSVYTTGLIIPGFHSEVQAASGKLPVSTKYVWGLFGTSLIVGRPADRKLTVDLWLSRFDWTTIDALNTFISGTLETLVGSIGYLQLLNEPNGYSPVADEVQYNNLVFAAFTPTPFDGQSVSSPILDAAASLYRDGPGAGEQSWLQRCTLEFLQSVPLRTLL